MKKLLILSGKGGTGKTTTASAFIRFSGAPAFADCDVDAPNLHLVEQVEGTREEQDYIGSQKAAIDPERCISCGMCAQFCRFGAVRRTGMTFSVDPYACEGCGVCTLVCGQKAISLSPDVAGRLTLIQGERTFSTAILKMGRGNSGKLVSSVKQALFLKAPEAPFAIIDGSPGIGCPVIASVSGVDLVLIVAEPSQSGISDLERLVRTTEGFRTKVAVCVNKYDLSPDDTRRIEDFCRDRQIPFLGCIPYDPTVSAAINQGKTVADLGGPACEALREIYRRTAELLEISAV